MSDNRWDAYAQTCVLNDHFYAAEPVQEMRANAIVERVVGSVLDVGGGDGYIAGKIRARGHWVKVVDASPVRVSRCWGEQHIPAETGDARALPYEDGSYDTVVLGEVLEHLDNPGEALAEACRVADKRVVVSLPLNGWCDPTHEWRVRLDVLTDPAQHAADPTKGEQIVLTLERGKCWPADYWQHDPEWSALFGVSDDDG